MGRRLFKAASKFNFTYTSAFISSKGSKCEWWSCERVFGKLGGLYGRLNLFSKPMQIFNLDESGISTVYRPGKKFTELGRKNVRVVTSGKRGKTHILLVCTNILCWLTLSHSFHMNIYHSFIKVIYIAEKRTSSNLKPSQDSLLLICHYHCCHLI